jgi:hypothetical protein
MKLHTCGFILASGLWLGQSAAQTTSPSEPAVWRRKPVPAGTISVIPFFFPGMSGPEFQVDFTNVSDETTDTLNVFLQESIKLDGKVYPRLMVRWAGGSELISPRARRSHKLAVIDFLPGERGRGRRLPLGVGLHTIKVLIGPATSEELTFAWWNPGD